MEELLALIGIASIPVTGVLVALWRSERARARRAEDTLYDLTVARHPASRPLPEGDLGARLDAMASEIERLGHAQRYTAQVIAERYERIAGRSMPSTTPH